MTSKIKVLGDPHLGKSFIHGVPLARRGEREEMMWAQFTGHLQLDQDYDYHICLGDLFDKAVVSYDVIDRTAQAYVSAAKKYPRTKFIVVKGNHDWQRDLDRISAFDLFSAIVASQENIEVVSGSFAVPDQFAVFAWHPTISAADLVKQADGNFDTVFGHWDIEDYGDHNPNLIPLQELAARGVRRVVTGHIHKPERFTDPETGIDVTVFGSMQPFAHGEEANDDLYVTLTKAELESTDLDLRNRCVRVLLKEGETFDEDLDCLQLTVKRLGGRDDSPIETVSLGEFDMLSIFLRAFKDAGVSPTVTEALLNRYNETRLADGV